MTDLLWSKHVAEINKYYRHYGCVDGFIRLYFMWIKRSYASTARLTRGLQRVTTACLLTAYGKNRDTWDGFSTASQYLSESGLAWAAPAKQMPRRLLSTASVCPRAFKFVSVRQSSFVHIFNRVSQNRAGRGNTVYSHTPSLLLTAVDSSVQNEKILSRQVLRPSWTASRVKIPKKNRPFGDFFDFIHYTLTSQQYDSP